MKLRALLLAGTILAGTVAPARAEPISAAIASAAVAAGASAGVASVAGSIGTALISTGISLSLHRLSQAFAQKPKVGDALSGVETSVQVGGDVPRQIAVGRVLSQGQRVYANTYGSSNEIYDQVLVLSDWRSAGLVSIKINGASTAVTQTGSGPGWKSYSCTAPIYAGQLAFWFYDGSQTSAESALVATANPAGRWTANSVLTGMSYVAVRMVYVKDAPLYANGIPDLSFEFDGAKLYDRRKDSTAGGSGAHRWSDPSTWEFSANPAVIAENYLRGFYLAGQLILGMGVPEYDLAGETWAAAANVCDETVTLDGGGTEPRYRCASILTADDGVQHRQVLDTLLSTFAGYLYDYAGSYVCQAGAAQAVVRTITDADLVIGQPITFAAKRSRAELVNTVSGTYLDPAAGYVATSYGQQTWAPDVAIDGEELGRQLDLASVTSRSQAERIAKIRRREARAQASAEVTLGFNHVDLTVGDWITWASARYGTRSWRVVERRLDPATRAVTLALAEINAAVFSWSAPEASVAPAVPVRVQPGTRIQTVSGFTLDAVAVTSADGATKVPALKFGWTPVVDPSVDSVEIEYRVVGATVSEKVSDPSPGDGAHLVTGVVNATVYEARATIRTTPDRPTAWTAWVQVTTAADYFTRVYLQNLDQQTQDRLSLDPAKPDSLGKALMVGQDALAHADALFDDLSRALSADPATRALSRHPAQSVQEALQTALDTVLLVSGRLEELRGAVFEAGITKAGGAWQVQGIAQAGQRINTVSVTLDAVRAQVNLLASTIITGGTLDGAAILAQITTVQQNLDGLLGEVSTKASQVSVTNVTTRITAAEQAVSALGSVVTSTVAGTVARDMATLTDAVADLSAYVSRMMGAVLERAATTQQVFSSRVEDNGRAVAESAKVITAVNGALTARVDETQRALNEGTTALAERASNVEVILRDAKGADPTLSARVRRIENAAIDPTTGKAAALAASEVAAEIRSAKGNDATLTARIARVDSASTDASTGKTAVTIANDVASEITNARGGLSNLSLRLQEVVNGYIDAATNRSALTIAKLAETAINDAKSGQPTLLARLSEIRSLAVDGTTGEAAVTIAHRAEVKSDYGSASGQIALVATSAPSGASAAYRMVLTANGASAGLTVLVMPDGSSRILLEGDKVVFGSSASASGAQLIYDSSTGTLTIPSLVVTTTAILPGAVNDLKPVSFGGDGTVLAGGPIGQQTKNAVFPGSSVTITTAAKTVLLITGELNPRYNVASGNPITVSFVLRRDTNTIVTLLPGTVIASSFVANYKFSQIVVLPNAGTYTIDAYYTFTSAYSTGYLQVDPSSYNILVFKGIT